MENPSLSLYRSLYLIRAAESRIIRHYPEDEMRTPMHMSMGQEVVSVALAHALGPQDQVYGYYRSHALFLAMTQDPERFFAELYGKVTGTAHGKAGSMHLASPRDGLFATSAIVGSTIPAAVGHAFANNSLNNGKVCAAVFGDGALETGDFWESLNAACAMRVPILFVCEDNSYAVHSPQSVRHGFDRIAEVVAKFRCAVFETESTDVEVVHAAVAKALAGMDRDGAGCGPAFLQVRTYRYLDHIGIEEDFDVGYRSREEFEAWRARDPLDIQRRRLLEQGMLAEEIERVERRIDERLDAAVAAARAALLPPLDELHVGVFYEGQGA